MKKKYYHSKTIWINFLILVLSLFDAQFFEAIGLNDHQITILTSVIIKVVAVGNIALRLFTNAPINSNKNESEQ